MGIYKKVSGKAKTRQTMVDIFLHQYKTTESMNSGISAPHRYRHPFYIKQDMQGNFVKAWNKDKKTICDNLINRMSKIYVREESFMLFTPATKNRLFIDDIIEAFKNYFPNIIDLTDVFTKITDFSLGDEQYNDITIEQIETLIQVDIDKINQSKNLIHKAFIVDDVYSSGKSINMTKLLISKHINQVTEVKTGVILKTK